MNKGWKIPLIWTIVLIALVFVFMSIANGIQQNHGHVSVKNGFIEIDNEILGYKLYTPSSASLAQPASAVLLLHGYQNDRETSSAYAIELARRGAVVMSLDEYGHGATSIGMAARGYVNHKVTVTYGNDSEEDGTFISISGPTRYKIMMNFSNLSFFHPRYTTDNDGNSMLDTSMGGIAAYAVLTDMDIVDAGRIGVSGHSMGTWAAWSVAAAYSGAVNEMGVDISPKATVLQCGEIFTDKAYDSKTIHFNNVMLLQAKYDEFSYFRDFSNMVTDQLIRSDLRTGFLGCSAQDAAWNTTYGSFADGSARCIQLLNTNHRLVTCNKNGIAASMSWFSDTIGLNSNLSSYNQIFINKELLVLLAMILAIASMLTFMELLLCTPFFGSIRQSLPENPKMLRTGWEWWRGAFITILITGITYPFMTQLGHGLMPLPEKIFRMTVGNGFFSWYLILILIMLLTTVLSWQKSKKGSTPLNYADLGLSSEKKPGGIDWVLCVKSVLLAFCMLVPMYIMVIACENFFYLDFRFIWPLFRGFSGTRFLQFLLYIPVFALFFILNNSKIFAQMHVKEVTRPGITGFLASWWKYALCMVGGVLLIVLIEYIPFFAGIGPGVDLLFSPLFGGPFISLLIVFVPQVLIFSVLCTYIYRRTGSVYTGAFTAAAMACWVITGGSTFL